MRDEEKRLSGIQKLLIYGLTVNSNGEEYKRRYPCMPDRIIDNLMNPNAQDLRRSVEED